MFYLFLYMYVMGMLSLIYIRNHIFLCLISLEFVVLTLLLMYVMYCLMCLFSLYLMVILMVFFVCEAVLGLSILVYLIRCYGNDYLNSLLLW
nr:NADH dehydrogenase subunit 4L [Acostemma sp.]